jgi:hypothetical protein
VQLDGWMDGFVGSSNFGVREGGRYWLCRIRKPFGPRENRIWCRPRFRVSSSNKQHRGYKGEGGLWLITGGAITQQRSNRVLLLLLMQLCVCVCVCVQPRVGVVASES